MPASKSLRSLGLGQGGPGAPVEGTANVHTKTREPGGLDPDCFLSRSGRNPPNAKETQTLRPANLNWRWTFPASCRASCPVSWHAAAPRIGLAKSTIWGSADPRRSGIPRPHKSRLGGKRAAARPPAPEALANLAAFAPQLAALGVETRPKRGFAPVLRPFRAAERLHGPTSLQGVPSPKDSCLALLLFELERAVDRRSASQIHQTLDAIFQSRNQKDQPLRGYSLTADAHSVHLMGARPLERPPVSEFRSESPWKGAADCLGGSRARRQRSRATRLLSPIGRRRRWPRTSAT